MWRMQVLQFVKTINIRSLYHGKNVTVFKPHKCSEFVIVQRGKSTRFNLMPKERKTFRAREQEKIGPYEIFLLVNLQFIRINFYFI